LKYLLIAAIVCTLTINGWSQTWTKVGNMPMTGRYYSVGLTYNNKEYMVTGGLTTMSFTDSMWEYTPATNTWKALSPFPGGHRYAAVGFVIGNKAYVGLGEDDITYALYNDFYSYDFATDTWTQVASFIGGNRYAAGTFVLGDKGYVIAGSTGGPPYLNDAYVYNAVTNQWSNIASLPITFGIETLTTFISHGNGYVIGGYVNPGDANEVLKYDTAQNKWINMGNIPDSGYAGLSVFNLYGKVYTVTGTASYADYVNANNTSTVYVYNYGNNIWTKESPFPGGDRYAGIGFSIDGIGYIMTGRGNKGYYNDIWKYVPEAGIDNINRSDNSLKVYPNPSSGLFVLSFNQPDTQTKIEIYNILGEKVFDDVINQSQKQYRLNMSSQPNGIYFYRVTAINGTLIREGKLSIDK